MRGLPIVTTVAVVLACLVAVPAHAAEAAYPTIELLDEGPPAAATKASQGPAAPTGDSVTLTVAAGEAGADDGPASPRRFVRGVRDTVFRDTYEVRYIDRMELNERAEFEPVLGSVEFGRWLDVTVTAIRADNVTAVVHYVHKRPVNVAPEAEPTVALPEADLRMVSRALTVPRGESRRLQVDDAAGGLRVSLTAAGE